MNYRKTSQGVLMTLSISSTTRLNNGLLIPNFGLGLYRSKSGHETEQAIKWAFEFGYRHFDTAQIYGNEQDLGEALKELEIDRNDVFITTKLWNNNQGSKTIPSFEESLKKLRMDYVDLFLMHWPEKATRISSWEEMTKINENGTAKAVGVSNFMVWHLKELLDNTSIVPSVNQVELSPYLYDTELIDYCKSKGIVVESYSPLTKGRKLSDKKLATIANKYRKTPAQILIRWALQHGLVVIPKSTNRDRLLENSRVFDFELAGEDMNIMDSWNSGLVTGWNPRNQD